MAQTGRAMIVRCLDGYDMEKKDKTLAAKELVRPLARMMARELSPQEIAQVNGGCNKDEFGKTGSSCSDAFNDHDVRN